MGDKPIKYCIRCDKELKQTVCFVDQAGICRVDFPMVSEHYGRVVIAYLCDECTTKLIDSNRIESII